jgi:hypothetical protein
MQDLGLVESSEPEVECIIMATRGPAAIFMFSTPEDKERLVSDYGVNFPMAGPFSSGVLPDVIGIVDGTADRIEAMGVSTLTRHEGVVGIPIKCLENKQVRQRSVCCRICDD